MTNERYKELMKKMGMPDNMSLLTILEQVVNETEQEIIEKCAVKAWNIGMNEKEFWVEPKEFGSKIAKEIRRW